MHEILRSVPTGAFVLDLGSRTGSFAAESDWSVVRVDAEVPPDRPPALVAARAEALPFRDRQFNAVISNHSLEHFEGLDAALTEIGRVIEPGGYLYIAVPDASTITDKIYRWMAHGGGHVNSFTSSKALADRITATTGLPCAGIRVLCTSLAFLNRANIQGPIQKKHWLFFRGSETVLRGLTYMFRQLDRWFGTRLSIYGWALYFGTGIRIEADPWTNVCIRCGAGHPSTWLRNTGAVRSGSFKCPQCGAKNYFTADEEYKSLR